MYLHWRGPAFTIPRAATCELQLMVWGCGQPVVRGLEECGLDGPEEVRGGESDEGKSEGRAVLSLDADGGYVLPRSSHFPNSAARRTLRCLATACTSAARRTVRPQKVPRKIYLLIFSSPSFHH